MPFLYQVKKFYSLGNNKQDYNGNGNRNKDGQKGPFFTFGFLININQRRSAWASILSLGEKLAPFI